MKELLKEALDEHLVSQNIEEKPKTIMDGLREEEAIKKAVQPMKELFDNAKEFGKMILEDYQKHPEAFVDAGYMTRTPEIITKRDREEEVKKAYFDHIRDKEWGDATEVLVGWILENNYIYTTKDDTKTEMWIYRDGIYVPQGKSEVKEILRNFLGKWYSAFVYNQVINKLEPDTFIDINEFFNQKHLDEIPVQNGLLNLNDKIVRPFTPDKIFFNKLPVKYNASAKCPEIDKFLSEVLSNEDDRKVFYEIGGFCLWKEYKFEKAFMLVGNGRNGKDKTLELIKRLIGIENCCSVPLSSLVPDSFIIAEFFGKMANLAGEISNQDLKETNGFKALTGRSLVSAPRKFLRPVTFQNYAKFIFACNELPLVYDNSKGFWDRWVLLEFPYTFVTQQEIDTAKDKTNLKLREEGIIERISTAEEMSGLLNKFLEGLDRLNEKKDFSTTKGSEEIKNLWIRKSNSFMAFCLDRIEEDCERYVTKKELRKEYINFCKQHKITPKSDFVMKKVLQENYGSSEERKMVGGFDIGWCWSGIKLNQDSKGCNTFSGYIGGNDLSLKGKTSCNPYNPKNEADKTSHNLDLDIEFEKIIDSRPDV